MSKNNNNPPPKINLIRDSYQNILGIRRSTSEQDISTARMQINDSSEEQLPSAQTPSPVVSQLPPPPPRPLTFPEILSSISRCETSIIPSIRPSPSPSQSPSTPPSSPTSLESTSEFGLNQGPTFGIFPGFQQFFSDYILDNLPRTSFDVTTSSDSPDSPINSEDSSPNITPDPPYSPLVFFAKLMDFSGQSPELTNPGNLERRSSHGFYSNLPTITNYEGTLPGDVPTNLTGPYRPVYNHWFYFTEGDDNTKWNPFSMLDSVALDNAFITANADPEYTVPTNGGRYDVNINKRQRQAVYWDSKPTEVRRCSWFHKTAQEYVPYEESIARHLEEEYKTAYETNSWQHRVVLEDGEVVVFHSPDVLVVLSQPTAVDVWPHTTQATSRPRIVKRGLNNFTIDDGEPVKIDHILFLVHGIGSACDLKFRSVQLVVDDFRSIALQLVQSHYKTSCESGAVNRVEILPVSWHSQLHSDDTGIDNQLKSITLESIPKLRAFTNDTLLDILFYTSPVYCQNIISTVGNELNRIYELFLKRNPTFTGGVSLGGHSLGSLIIFDILAHQHFLEKDEDIFEEADVDVILPMKTLNKPAPLHRKMSRRISYMMGSVGTGQPQIIYPQLAFHPTAFFAFGSPIGMFVTVRGLELLGEQFAFPTCSRFFNIFHPYDPVAYRIEALVNPELTKARPVLIPHHKGRKRMHLELKETVARVGADIKQKIVESVRNTWNSVYQLAPSFHRPDQNLEEEVDRVIEEQLEQENHSLDQEEVVNQPEEDLHISCGLLNGGRRIDYVLQEAPLEFINEYIFAVTSHVCYWESEDTMLLMLKEIYDSVGISADSQIPQQTMTIERTVAPNVPIGVESLAHYISSTIDNSRP